MAKNIPVELPSYHPRTERPGDWEGFGPKKKLSVISKILLFVKYGCFLTFYQGSPPNKSCTSIFVTGYVHFHSNSSQLQKNLRNH